MRDLMAMMPLAALSPTTAPAGNVDMTATAPAVGGGAGMPANVSDVVTTQPGTTQPGGAAVGDAAGKQAGPPFSQIFLIIGVFVVLYFVMFRGQKKAEKSRKTLLSQMKKGDKVMTIGGLVARVVSMDDDEVVLKIDESANVKATFKKTSIQQVLGDEKAK